jgi:hypothetical protein
MCCLTLAGEIGGRAGFAQETETETQAEFEPEELVEVELLGSWLSGTIVKGNGDGSYRVLITYQGKRAERTIPSEKIRRPGPTAVKPLTSMRKWTDASGAHSLEAHLLKFEEGTVELMKENGTTIQVPIEKFCVADQRLVRRIVRRAEEKNARLIAGTEAGSDRFAREERANSRDRPAAGDRELLAAENDARTSEREPRGAAEGLEAEEETVDANVDAAEPNAAEEVAESTADAAPAFSPEPAWGALEVWRVVGDSREFPLELSAPIDFTVQFDRLDASTTKIWIHPEQDRVIVYLAGSADNTLHFFTISSASRGLRPTAPEGQVVHDFSPFDSAMLTSAQGDQRSSLHTWSFTERGSSQRGSFEDPEFAEIVVARWVSDTHVIAHVGDRLMCINTASSGGSPIVYRGVAGATNFALSPGRTTMYVALPDGIAAVESATGIQQGWLPLDRSPAQALAVNDQASRLVAVAGTEARIWDLSTGSELPAITLTQPPVADGVDWGQDGFFLVGNTDIYSIQSSTMIHRFQSEGTGGPPIGSAASGKLFYLVPVTTSEGTGLRLNGVSIPPPEVVNSVSAGGSEGGSSPTVSVLGSEGVTSGSAPGGP